MTSCLLDHHMPLPPPPQDTRYVRYQAGGHHTRNGDRIIPNLEHNDGSFLKLYRDPPSPRGATELAFYQRVFEPCCTDQSLLALRDLLPRFYDLYTATFNGKEVRYLKVEDVTRKFSRPCVLDIKLKADVHDPASTHSHHIYTFARQHGFLIDGMQLYHSASGKYLSFSKQFGRQLDKQGARKALAHFLNADSGLNVWLIQAFLHRLRTVHQWAINQRLYSFYRSSLLLVYDASGHVKDSILCSNLEDALEKTELRMVDFAKVYPSENGDPSYAAAVANLAKYFEQILSEGCVEKSA